MRRAAFVLLLLLPLVLPAGNAEAISRKAIKAYEQGEEALAAGRWAEARKSFEEALAADDSEGNVRISGVKRMDYYPSLGLARAAIELGDTDAARAALARFDEIKKPGSDQQALASALRSRLSAGQPRPTTPSTPAAPTTAPEALAAKAALDSGDLASAKTLARKAPTDSLAQEVLAAVDALLAEKFKAAKRDQEAGALGAAQAKLQDILAADPGNSAAKSLLSAVQADARSAKDLMGDARAALDAGQPDRAEELARQARQRDASLSDAARALEREASAARRASKDSPRPAQPSGPSADGLLKKARSALDAGRLADARRAASDALAASPGQKAEVEAVRSAIAKRAGEADDALRLARAAAAGGRFVEARQRAGQAESLDKGLASDARRVLSQVDEGEAQAGRLLAKIEAHLESGAAEAARSSVDELASSFPEHPELAGLRASVAGSGELVAGLRAYFRGDWAVSIDTLTPLVASNAERSDLLAVLGSAHATRGLLSEDGASDLTRAKELFAQALAANPELKLDPRYFSPRVREIFEASRGS